MIWLVSTLPRASRMGVTSVSSIGTMAFRNISNATPNGVRVLNIIVIIKCAHALLYLTSMRIRPQFKLWFVDEEGDYVFGLGTMGLLAEIDKLGSISAATRKLGMSYRYALERITIVEKRLGRQLVDRTRGGKEGGGAKLTAFGYELLADYRGMEGSLNQLTKWYVDLSD